MFSHNACPTDSASNRGSVYMSIISLFFFSLYSGFPLPKSSPISTRRMVLSGRQREELNKAIAEYLGANGYLNTLNEFQKEADLNTAQDVEKKFVGKDGHPMWDVGCCMRRERVSSMTNLNYLD